MPESIFSGAKEGRFQDAGGDWTAATTVVLKSDSESSPEMPEDDETTRGDILFAGEYTNDTVNVYTMAEYATLKTKMINDDRIDFQIKDMDDNWQDVALDFIPRVQKPNQYATGNRRFFVLMIRKYNTD